MTLRPTPEMIEAFRQAFYFNTADEGADPIELGLIAALAAMPVHSDDLAVDRFFDAMKAKLAKKRAEGYGGWDDPQQCRVEFLSRKLREHVEKGDPIDVANFAMMLHQRGSAITPRDGRFEAAAVVCSVMEMQTSAGTDYFVSVVCDGRQITPHMFKQRWKAEYEVAEWQWLFGQGEKPDILSYGPQEGEGSTYNPYTDPNNTAYEPLARMRHK